MSPTEGMEPAEGLVWSEELGSRDDRTVRPERPLADDDVSVPSIKAFFRIRI